MVEPSEEIAVVRDPAANRRREAAVEGNTKLLVTGDSDLLDLVSFRGTQILKPAGFLLLLDTEDL